MQLNVAVLILPKVSNVTVPLLALKVVPELRVKAPATVIVPDGAVNTAPELKVKIPFTSNGVKLLKLAVAPVIVKFEPVSSPLNPERA